MNVTNNKDLNMSIQLECDCTCININEWERLMENAVETDGQELREMIKIHEPDLYESLALDFRNPYEGQSQKTDTHYIYVHSAIEYFLLIT